MPVPTAPRKAGRGRSAVPAFHAVVGIAVERLRRFVQVGQGSLPRRTLTSRFSIHPETQTGRRLRSATRWPVGIPDGHVGGRRAGGRTRPAERPRACPAAARCWCRPDRRESPGRRPRSTPGAGAARTRGRGGRVRSANTGTRRPVEREPATAAWKRTWPQCSWTPSVACSTATSTIRAALRRRTRLWSRPAPQGRSGRRPSDFCGPSRSGTTCSHPQSQARALVSAKRSTMHGFHHNLPILEKRSAYK